MYQYTSEEGSDPLFTFTTKNGLSYFVAFRKLDFGLDYFQNLYSVDFWEIYNQTFIKDTSIEKTIIAILFSFFENHPNTILHYVCDSIDFRQNARSKLFEMWYNNSKNNEFSKLDLTYSIEKEEIEYKLEFVFKNEFYDINTVKENVIIQLNEFSTFK
ncbi:DUF6169 family protein [Flavobacterium sp. SUN052]|uniref:DUF6169 family protein n=1 Tax=Flavobacterium sp. SUN052 TaxID=3002441 RepID=UPI00237E3956|nr:DUF6169 family protein [Flavobacterium sp. SUN052]MEC4003441.1 DUF6169 family protein [Flavobacterium sp. SUN052]